MPFGESGIHPISHYRRVVAGSSEWEREQSQPCTCGYGANIGPKRFHQ